MRIEFQEKYLIMLGKEYRIKSDEDERFVYQKQEQIYKTTGRKPRIIVSLRNPE